MMNSQQETLKAVGYIRVSTEKQNVEDRALKRQEGLIREFCERAGMKLLGIYEDTASAAAPFNDVRRSGLQDASIRARREGAALVVTEPTRLFRDEAAAQTWLDEFRLPIITVQDRDVLSEETVLEAVSAGEMQADRFRKATQSTLSLKAAEGQPLGSPGDKRAANAASVRARAERSADIVQTIAHILETDPAYRDLSHKAFAALLNRRNILTGWGRPWTAAGVRRQRSLAEELLRERVEIENDETVLVAVPPMREDAQNAQAPETVLEEERITQPPPFAGLF